MRMLDLFSGIGGFALAAQWCWGDELDLVGFCEIDKYAQKVLNKNFPGVTIYNDITKLDGKEILEVSGGIDLITGGFP
jgi:DNA (cytosine-5)-methyltransferase 1